MNEAPVAAPKAFIEPSYTHVLDRATSIRICSSNHVGSNFRFRASSDKTGNILTEIRTYRVEDRFDAQAFR